MSLTPSAYFIEDEILLYSCINNLPREKGSEFGGLEAGNYLPKRQEKSTLTSVRQDKP
jgi:hypothetical protein